MFILDAHSVTSLRRDIALLPVDCLLNETALPNCKSNLEETLLLKMDNGDGNGDWDE